MIPFVEYIIYNRKNTILSYKTSLRTSKG